MSTTTEVAQRKQDVIAPVLLENIPVTTGHYQVQHTYVLDSTTNMLVGTNVIVTLGV